MNKAHPIQSIRLACKISQEELGKMFKPSINYATISKIENGYREFPKKYENQVTMIMGSLAEFHSILKTKKVTNKMRGRRVKTKKVSK